jgi:nucleoside-diphosphate-sugar epimerase
MMFKEESDGIQPVALVTGATGAIGPQLVRTLLDAGYQVRALVRQTPSRPLFDSNVELIQGDIGDMDVLRAACADVQVVFHLAAKLHINQPHPDMEQEYYDVNVGGTSRVAEAARDAGVGRLVFFSTINVYGSGDKEAPIDETHPLNPQTFYARSKAEAESVALAHLPAVVLRLSAVYGPGMKGNYARLCRAIARGRFLMIGTGQNRRTLVHVHDVCRAALVAAQHPSAVGQIYNVTDGHVHTLRQIVDAIYGAYNRRMPHLHIPARPVRGMAGAIGRGLAFLGVQSGIGVELVDKMLEDIAVSGEKIMHELEFRPEYDLQSGWRQTVGLLEHPSPHGLSGG